MFTLEKDLREWWRDFYRGLLCAIYAFAFLYIMCLLAA